MTTLGSTEIDHLAGREKQTIMCLPQSNTPSAACAAELTRTDTTWQHSTNDLPLDPVYIYLPADQQPRFVYSDTSEQRQETQRILRTVSYYETARQGGKQYGNLTARADYASTGTGWVATADRTAYYTFYPTTVYWIFNRVAKSELFRYCSGCPNGSRESMTKYYYDGATSETTPPTLGRLTQQIDGYAGTEATTQYTYWSNGNLRLVIDPLNRTTETFYDSRFQAYPVCTKNALGQITKQRYYGVPGSGDANCSTNAGDAVWAGTNTIPTTGRFFGELQDETDANNIVTGVYRWDSEGRIAAVIQPGDDDTNSTLRFSYTAYAGANQPFWVKQEQRDNPMGATIASYLETRTFYDGLSQVIQTQSEGANSTQSVVVSTQYNAEGQPSKKNAPYFGAGLTTFQTPDFTKPTTQMIYDALGRVKKVLAPDGTTYTEHAYAVAYNAGDGDFTTPRPIDYTIDANRRFVRRAYDAFGNLRIVSEATGSWPAGGAPDWGTELRTRYTYDVEGQLVQVQDHPGNITNLTYDPLGRKASLNDRDMGAWTYGYDLAGNLTRQTDAKNQTTCLYYDALDRITGKVYQSTTSCPATQPAIVATGYTYDTGTNAIGRRASMAVYQTDGSVDNSAGWTYDTRGRVTSETRTVDGVSYVEDLSYDAASRVATLTYPPEVGGTREAISHNYDTAGQLTQVRSTTYSLNYASGMTYTAAGQLAEIIYGRLDGQQNGTTEHRGYYGSGGNWDVKPTTGLRNYGNLWRVRLAHNANNVALFDQAWNYDLAGNVTRSNEAVTAAGSAWPTTYSFQDAFNSKNSSAYTWSSYQTVPYNEAGNNVVKSTGTGSSYDANFYRTSTLTTGNGIQVRFKVDATNTSAHFALETADGTKRLCVRADNGMIQLQYNDGGGFRYPADLVKNVTLNAWYVARIVIDDTRGAYVEVYPESNPSQRASYQQYLPTGLAWRFHHWIYRGTAYIDDYREFSTSGMTWTPDERMTYGYDALNRLTSATQDSGANGFTQSYQYNAIGNLTYRSDIGDYAYPPSGPTSVRPHAATWAGEWLSYTYDANGNMATRFENGVTYTHTWDAENRLKAISGGGHTVTYTYDADGQRVKKVEDAQTTIYLGNSYEKNVTANTVTTYYYAGPQRVAQRQGTTVSYFVGDNLGSTSVTMNASGVEVGRQKYFPFGAPRVQTGTLKTDFRLTGQRSEEANFGSLYDYGARFYRLWRVRACGGSGSSGSTSPSGGAEADRGGSSRANGGASTTPSVPPT